MIPASRLQTLSPSALTDLFAQSAIARSVAIESRKPDVGNAHYRTMDNIYRELKRRGADAQRALLPLLDHDSPDVRLNAASLALEFAASQAEAVLESLRHLHGLIAYEASGVLKEWKNGSLRFP